MRIGKSPFTGVVLLLLATAGCGDVRATLEDVARFANREFERQRDAESVRADTLLEASFKGNDEMVRHMLEADPKQASERVRSRDATGMTALHLATWGGHTEIVRLLLKHGADVNARDGSGDTPLMLAVRWGLPELMDLLLAHGADASIRDDQGRTLLHRAAEYGHVAVMRVLVSRGFDVDVQSRIGTPLHSAAFGRRLEATRFLLDNGAHPNLLGYLDWAPLHVAASGGPAHPSDPEIVKLLIERGADVSAKTDGGGTPLSLAALSRENAVVEILLFRGARPASSVAGGNSALRSAIEAESPEIARMLLARGADPNQLYRPPHLGGLLHRAADQESLEVAEVLLEYGADPDAVDDHGLTPLHVAAREGDPEMVRLLLKHRANVNARDEWKWTPLHYAASRRRLEVTRVLLNHGADRNVRNTSRETPYKLAWGPDAESVRQLLGPPAPAKP